MYALILLTLITVCYAAYNLLVKVSGSHAGASAPIFATIGLQLAALSVSLVYLAVLMRQGAAVVLPPRALLFGIAAGCCIGAAEVMYFYLFRGIAGEPGMSAGVAIPVIVGGTIVIAMLVAGVVFGETFAPVQWAGIMLTLGGMLLLALGARQ